MTPRETFGDIDIYLFDQLLKGRITARDLVLDAGCGSGRNVEYLMREGIPVWAIDSNPVAVEEVRALAGQLAPATPPDRFRVEAIDRLGFSDGSFTVVVASAVLHFARDGAHFEAMLDELWRVLAPGGMLFARLATLIGIADRAVALGRGQFRLPDGSTRFLIDGPDLTAHQQRLGAQLLEPIKTTLVQDQRAMTTWVLRKP
jgi:SAM-dependent methyltransferase